MSNILLKLSEREATDLIVGTPIEGLHLSLNRLQALTTLVDRLGAERSLKREPVEFEVQGAEGGLIQVLSYKCTFTPCTNIYRDFYIL